MFLQGNLRNVLYHKFLVIEMYGNKLYALGNCLSKFAVNKNINFQFNIFIHIK